ncbi:MAG TPA: urease accessory UreF family protein [Usitatibacter sp.]|nr:urease accessory UreF family protein [Usitatibacter sp.]
MTQPAALVRLLQLASPTLPVGAYSYSQGLEAAVEARIVVDELSARDWIRDLLALSLQAMEAPVFLRLAAAWREQDPARAVLWNEEFLASRETAELRAETLQMGYSLRELLRSLDVAHVDALDVLDELAYPTAFAFAAAAWNIEPCDALAGYLFAWIENQVLAAVKAVPLGQAAGQRMLFTLAACVPPVVEAAAAMSDADLHNFAPGLALLSSLHETQYSRLFRS